LYTFGYEFKPWKNDKAIADAQSILNYLRETAREYGVDRKIRNRHKVLNASWSSEAARWKVEIERRHRRPNDRLVPMDLLRIRILRLRERLSPFFEGAETFRGTIVHPQKWPEGLDYAGRNVVIIGSGATAVTLAPAMAETAAHVTLLQRTPSYVMSLPSQDRLANLLRRMLPEEQAHALIRRKNAARQYWFWKLCRTFPRTARDPQAIAGGLSGRYPFQPAVRPLGSASLRPPRRRPLQSAEIGAGLHRHRQDRSFRRRRRAPRLGRDAASRHHRDRDRAQSASDRRHLACGRRKAGRPARKGRLKLGVGVAQIIVHKGRVRPHSARQQTAAQRAIAEGGDLVAAAVRQDIGLDSALEKI